MEFQVGQMAVQVVRTAGEDYAIEFRVEEPSGEVSHFAILWENEDSYWDQAKISMDPKGGNIPVKAMEWAMEYARMNP